MSKFSSYVSSNTSILTSVKPAAVFVHLDPGSNHGSVLERLINRLTKFEPGLILERKK